MRQIGTLADGRQVRRLGDFLLTQGVRIQVEQADAGFAIWAIDEDRVAQARDELNRFVQDPHDERYVAAEREAARLRDELIRNERARRGTVVDVRRQWGAPRSRPLTFLLIVSCCVVGFATDFGENRDGAVWQKLLIASYRYDGEFTRYSLVFKGDSEILHGQVWRLITPIFLHGSVAHLIMNMMVMQSLGTLIEIRRGTWRLAFLVVTTAIVSNVAQYLFSGPSFCGISGVALGLFGYIWMKSEFDPSAGIAIPRSSVTFMFVFLAICMTGLIGQIANAAHISGLLTGMLLGYAPVLIRRIFGR